MKMKLSEVQTMADTWMAEGLDVVFYPSGLKSRSAQYVPPVLVGSKPGEIRRCDRFGHVASTSTPKEG